MRFVPSVYIPPCNYGLQSGLLTAWCGVCRVRYLSSVYSAPCSYVPLSVLFALRIGLSRYVLRPPSSSRSTLGPFAMARNLAPAPCGICRARYLSPVYIAPCSYGPPSALLTVGRALIRYVTCPLAPAGLSWVSSLPRDGAPAPERSLPCSLLILGLHCSVQLWTSVGIAHGRWSWHH